MEQKANNRNKILYKRAFKYNYQNKTYSEKKWFYLTSRYLQFDENKIILQNRSLFLSINYLESIFKDNVIKSTFYSHILPCVLFLFFSLISFLVGVISYYRGNLLFEANNTNVLYFFIFLGIIFLILGFILLVKIVVFKEKCFYGNNRGNKGYILMKKDEYTKRLNIFSLHREKAYLFFPLIETKRLIIRELNEFDARAYFQMASNPKVSKYMGWKIHESLEESINIIQKTRIEYGNKKIFRLGLILKETNSLIGYIGLSTLNLTETTCEVVYALAEEFWGHAYVLEALEAFLDYLIANNYTTIYAGHVSNNIASGKILLKAGFIRDPKRDSEMMIHNQKMPITNYIYLERKTKT